MEVKNFDNSIEKFIESLEIETIAKVVRTINFLEKFGHELELPHSRKIGNNFFELRIRGRQEVRIFYTFKKSEAILLHSFIKKSMKTPRREIDTAMQRLRSLDTI